MVIQVFLLAVATKIRGTLLDPWSLRKSTKRKRPECFSGLSSKKVELKIKK